MQISILKDKKFCQILVKLKKDFYEVVDTDEFKYSANSKNNIEE